MPDHSTINWEKVMEIPVRLMIPTMMPAATSRMPVSRGATVRNQASGTATITSAAVEQALPGDFDGNDRVDFSDFFVFADQWRQQAFGYTGDPNVKTPNIDRIAKEGAVFTDWYGQQSCTAGRAAFITGQSPMRTGLTKVGFPGASIGLQKEDPTLAEMLKLNKGKGGLIALLGTADFREVERRVGAGDAPACEVYAAMVYQICKNITALLPAFEGEGVDRILLTGGLARSEMLVADITAGVKAMGCGVTAYPGENEMRAVLGLFEGVVTGAADVVGHLVVASFFQGLVQASGDIIEGFVPADAAPAGLGFFHRMIHPVGVVCQLSDCQPFGTHRAVADGRV